LGIIALAGVAFLVIFNALIMSNALEKLINGAQKDVTLKFDTGIIWWPTHISGENFQLIVHDPAIQAELALDEYQLDWNPLRLFDKKFHATRVRATGVTFALRKTRPISELCRQPPGLPDIPGQTRPPGAVRGDCSAQTDTARKPGKKPKRGQVFEVELENVKATGLNELRFERYRARGYADFSGHWSFNPTFETSIQLPSFTSEPWTIHVDGEPIAHHLTMNGGATVETLNLRDLSGWLEKVSLRGELVGRGLDIAHFARAMGSEGDGALDVYFDAHIDQGAPQYLDARVGGSRITFDAGKFAVRGSPDFGLTFVDGEQGARLRTGTATITDVRLGDAKESTDIYVRTTSDSYVKPSPLRASVGIEARTSNLEPIMAALSGLPKTILDLLIAQSTDVEASGRLRAEQGEARLDPVHVNAGPLSVDGKVQLSPSMNGRLKAELGPVTVTKKLGGSKPKTEPKSKPEPRAD